jgi:hypothetical protein
MVNQLSAPGLYARGYFKRYSDDAVDLCDVLASFTTQGKCKLDELSRILGLARKTRWRRWLQGGRVRGHGAHSGSRGLLRNRRGEHLPRLAAIRVDAGRADRKRRSSKASAA